MCEGIGHGRLRSRSPEGTDLRTKMSIIWVILVLCLLILFSHICVCITTDHVAIRFEFAFQGRLEIESEILNLAADFLQHVPLGSQLRRQRSGRREQRIIANHLRELNIVINSVNLFLSVACLVFRSAGS